jgi:hypothetical protein
MKGSFTIFALLCVTFLLGWFGHRTYSYDPQSGVQWQFVAAAERGDLAEVQRCFAHGARIDAVPVGDGGFVFGFPALLEAAGSGRADVVEWLLAHGANPNLKGSDGAPLDAAEPRSHAGRTRTATTKPLEEAKST